MPRSRPALPCAGFSPRKAPAKRSAFVPATVGTVDSKSKTRSAIMEEGSMRNSGAAAASAPQINHYSNDIKDTPETAMLFSGYLLRPCPAISFYRQDIHADGVFFEID